MAVSIMEKIFKRKANSKCWGRTAVLSRVVNYIIPKKVTFRGRSERGGGIRHVDVWGTEFKMREQQGSQLGVRPEQRA